MPGVGGGVEAREKVDIVPLIKWTLVFLAGLAVVFGLGLAFAAKKFAVQVGPEGRAGAGCPCTRSLRCVRICRLRAVCGGSC